MIETGLSNITDKINPKSVSKNMIKKHKNSKIQKSVKILSINMVRHINGLEISGRLQCDCKAYIKQLAGAKSKRMKDHMKHSLRENPDPTGGYE